MSNCKFENPQKLMLMNFRYPYPSIPMAYKNTQISTTTITTNKISQIRKSFYLALIYAQKVTLGNLLNFLFSPTA